MNMLDQTWREYNVHNDNDDDDAQTTQDSNEDNDWSSPHLSLFDTDHETELETIEFPVHAWEENNSRIHVTTLHLTCQEDYHRSTGIAVWRGSEVLAHYLMQHPDVVRQKTVLELGAGVGLLGLTAQALGANRVLWTDGDQAVLDNLRHNVSRNRPTTSAQEDGAQPQQPQQPQRDPIRYQCPQLIWGKQLEEFVQCYGQNQVLLATDVFYMTNSLKPLWNTVNQLLQDNGLFLVVNSCASQSPMEYVLSVAKEHGFTWTTLWVAFGPATNKANEDEQIYIFERNPRNPPKEHHA